VLNTYVTTRYSSGNLPRVAISTTLPSWQKKIPRNFKRRSEAITDALSEVNESIYKAFAVRMVHLGLPRNKNLLLLLWRTILIA
jgi:hypothetical protein